MSLRLTDLRKAALREYPEFGRAVPVRWRDDLGRVLMVTVALYLAAIAVIIVVLLLA